MRSPGEAEPHRTASGRAAGNVQTPVGSAAAGERNTRGCYKHSAPLEPGVRNTRGCYKHSAPLEPGVRNTRGRYKHSAPLEPEGFLFPPELAQGLRGASAKDLANVEITPSGEGLRWPNLDADLVCPDL